MDQAFKSKGKVKQNIFLGGNDPIFYCLAVESKRERKKESKTYFFDQRVQSVGIRRAKS